MTAGDFTLKAQINGALADAFAEIERLQARVAELEADLVQHRELTGQQQELIAAHQHASVLAHHAYKALAVEADRLRGMVMGGIIVLTPPPGGWRN